MDEIRPEGEITIIIRLMPSPRGYHLNIDSTPRDAFGDVLIEACRRAAQHLERQLQAKVIADLLQAGRPRLIG